MCNYHCQFKKSFCFIFIMKSGCPTCLHKHLYIYKHAHRHIKTKSLKESLNYYTLCRKEVSRCHNHIIKLICDIHKVIING